MNIDDLVKDAINLTDERFEMRLNSLVRENSSFRNLDENNREVVIEIFKKFKDRLRKGYDISDRLIKDEYMHLYKNRLELNLTEEDLRDIKEIMRGFQGDKKKSGKSLFAWLGF